MKILVINCGSSSIKFKVFEMPEAATLMEGSAEKIGETGSLFKYRTNSGEVKEKLSIKNHNEGLELIAKVLTDKKKGVIASVSELKGVGHRVVHGGEGFGQSVIIDSDVIAKIENCIQLAPLHNPHNLAGIKSSIKLFPDSVQVASFDTAFHSTLPEKAFLYPIPYELYTKHRIRRYGFHGTSHRYVARRAASLMEKPDGKINAITCHLGNGCSMAAVKNGHSVDTSMGMTPLEGLMMGTRSGDIDPGIIFYLMGSAGYTDKEVNDILNKKSGLLGLSGVSNDFRDLLQKYEEKQVASSIEIYSYKIKKYIGSYMAVLGCADAIVFTAGVGEKTPEVREKALEGLDALFGIVLDKEKNKANFSKEEDISAASSKVRVFVIPTDEEAEIAADTYSHSK